MKCHPQSTPALQDLAKQLEGGHRVAMLTLRDEEGRLSSQPMTPQEMDAQGAIWILASHGATARRIGGGAPVNLAFSDEGDAKYVSVSAQATLVDDAARKKELWSAMARPWFPGGPEDPELLLLKLQPEHADIWEGPQSSVVRALAIAASVAAAKPIGLGEQRSLETSPGTAR